ncbi:MAG: putative molybdenum carrier protein [Chloroflexi bacterium]|nr:putative molybdenum carrier protein [Chloroflexota bacterium]
MSSIVAWTGHRPDLFHDPDAARAAVDATAQDLANRARAERFLVGGQRGVDTWAAQAAIALNVPFTLALPLAPAEFAAGWLPADREVLERLVLRAAEVHIVGGRADAAYAERNRLLGARSDLLVAVWTRLAGGGTAETIAHARAAGTPVREIVLPLAQMAHPAHGRGI